MGCPLVPPIHLYGPDHPQTTAEGLLPVFVVVIVHTVNAPSLHQGRDNVSLFVPSGISSPILV